MFKFIKNISSYGVTSITAGTGISLTGTGPGNVVINLANSGVTAGTYGSSTLIPIIQVDNKGRVIVAGSVALSETYTGTVTSITAGSGMNFTTITGSGPVVLGTPSAITQSSTNGLTTNSHTHEITGEDARIWGTTLTDGSGSANYAAIWTDTDTLGVLPDPNEDRIMFWDDSATANTYLKLGTNLSI